MEPGQLRLRFVGKNSELFDAIGQDANVAGATAFVWASPEAVRALVQTAGSGPL